MLEKISSGEEDRKFGEENKDLKKIGVDMDMDMSISSEIGHWERISSCREFIHP